MRARHLFIPISALTLTGCRLNFDGLALVIALVVVAPFTLAGVAIAGDVVCAADARRERGALLGDERLESARGQHDRSEREDPASAVERARPRAVRLLEVHLLRASGTRSAQGSNQ